MRFASHVEQKHPSIHRHSYWHFLSNFLQIPIHILSYNMGLHRPTAVLTRARRKVQKTLQLRIILSSV